MIRVKPFSSRTDVYKRQGLSYAEFSYSDVSLSSDSLTSEDSITASVQLKNTGACTGTEVVQLYIQDVAALSLIHI